MRYKATLTLRVPAHVTVEQLAHALGYKAKFASTVQLLTRRLTKSHHLRRALGGHTTVSAWDDGSLTVISFNRSLTATPAAIARQLVELGVDGGITVRGVTVDVLLPVSPLVREPQLCAV